MKILVLFTLVAVTYGYSVEKEYGGLISNSGFGSDLGSTTTFTKGRKTILTGQQIITNEKTRIQTSLVPQVAAPSQIPAVPIQVPQVPRQIITDEKTRIQVPLVPQATLPSQIPAVPIQVPQVPRQIITNEKTRIQTSLVPQVASPPQIPAVPIQVPQVPQQIITNEKTKIQTSLIPQSKVPPQVRVPSQIKEPLSSQIKMPLPPQIPVSPILRNDLPVRIQKNDLPLPVLPKVPSPSVNTDKAPVPPIRNSA